MERKSIIDDSVRNYMESKRRKLKLEQNPVSLASVPKRAREAEGTRSDLDDEICQIVDPALLLTSAANQSFFPVIAILNN